MKRALNYQIIGEIERDTSNKVIMIVGHKGVGKTTLLKQLIESIDNSCYIDMCGTSISCIQTSELIDSKWEVLLVDNLTNSLDPINDFKRLVKASQSSGIRLIVSGSSIINMTSLADNEYNVDVFYLPFMKEIDKEFLKLQSHVRRLTVDYSPVSKKVDSDSLCKIMEQDLKINEKLPHIECLNSNHETVLMIYKLAINCEKYQHSYVIEQLLIRGNLTEEDIIMALEYLNRNKLLYIDVVSYQNVPEVKLVTTELGEELKRIKQILSLCEDVMEVDGVNIPKERYKDLLDNIHLVEEYDGWYISNIKEIAR